jgi:hypothetical protein
MENILHEIENKLKFKLNKDSIYFRAENNVDLKDYEITFDRGAILQKTDLKPISDEEIYISVMYETNTDKDEGVVRIPVSVLAVLLVSRKIIAINIKSDRLDKEISELVLRT